MSSRALARACERGYTLVELVVAIALFGLLLLMLTAIDQQVRHSLRRFRVGDAHRLAFTVVPQLRADLERAVARPARFLGQPAGPTLLALVVVEGGERRLVAWRLEPGRIRRGQLDADGATVTVTLTLEGDFAAVFGEVAPARGDTLVTLDVQDTGGSGDRLLSFHHRVGSPW